MKKRIYLIEDDVDLCDMVRGILESYGYQIAAFHTGRDARAAIRREPPDLCLVDLALPDMNGLDLVREMWTDVRFGLIILTGRAEVSDRVLGLELGADDYIVKPFNLREVLARIRAVLRRYEPRAAAPARASGRTQVGFAGWLIDVEGRELRDPTGHVVDLTTAEFNLLTIFLERPKRVLSRDQLLDLLKGAEWSPFDRSIDTLIARLRKKIETDAERPGLIKTVRGVGYVFSVDVTRD